MKNKITLTTNKKFLFSNILGVATLIFTLFSISILNLSETQKKSTLERNTLAWANALAQVSVSYLLKNDNEGLNAELKKLVTPTDISYIHIYKKHTTETNSEKGNIGKTNIDVKSNGNNITFFTGFNKSIYYPSIPDKIKQIQTLSTFRYQNNHLEIIVKIEQEQVIYGYLYIQVSTKKINDFSQELTIALTLLLLLGLIFFAILTRVIKNKIEQPITTMLESVQEVTNSKNYNHTIKTLPLIEFDILAQNINFLLKKIERQQSLQDDKYKQTLSENKNLVLKVQTRTDALKESNEELLSTLAKLHQFQGQLVETEKMASLGDMVAGIAHEVNTPIGLGVTASSLMVDRLDEIKTAFDNKTLKSSQLKKFLNQGEENIGIIFRNLKRAAKLISSFKKVAVDQSSVELSKINVKELIDEVSITLQGKLNRLNIELIVHCPENLVIESKAGPINQVLLNLTLNSIIHGFENRPKGVINISVFYLSNQLHLCYKDDGIGIDESIKTKIFEPFTTTKRGSGGSGLGLHLVYNIITQALNGHIDVESSANLGTTFNITFPALLTSEQ